MKSLVNRALSLLGLRLVKLGKRPRPIEFPVELDQADREILEFVLDNELTMVSRERLFATLMACRHVCDEGVEGDFVECGVWRGGNSLLAADVFRRLGPGRRTHLFDTFAGMTPPGAADVDRSGPAQERYRLSQRETHNEWCFASLEDVRANFQRRGLETGVSFVQGDVIQSLRDSTNVPDKISVLRLDTDWFESTKIELEVLYPRLQIGGLLIVDDYGHWGGARKAVDEYFASVARPFLQYVDYTGRVGVKCQAG
jgi:O-methyltransferase